MATKFELQFSKSNKEIYASRGAMISKQMDNAVSLFKKELETKEFNLSYGIADMMDFGKSNTTALDVKRPESYEAFVKELHSKSVELELVRLHIKVLEKLEKEYFTEVEETKEKENDEA